MKGLVTRNTHVQYETVIGKRFLPNGPFSAFFNDFEIFNGPFLIILHRLLWAIFQVNGTMVHGPLPSLSLMKALSLLVRKLWPRLKFFKSRSNSRSRSRGQKLWYHVKGLVTRNTDVQYESPISSSKKVMAKVKVFQK